MIYVTMGVPSRFSEWCEAIFRELLAEAGAVLPDVFVADTLDQVGTKFLAWKAASALVVSRRPQRKLTEAVFAAAVPFMVTLDEPQNAVGALMCDHKEGFSNAVRLVASCLTAMLLPASHRDALVLYASENPSSRDVARAIVRHYGIGLDQAAIDKAIKTLADYAPLPPDLAGLSATDDIINSLSSRAAVCSGFGYRGEDHNTPATILASALAPLWSHLKGGPLQEIFWHPALFFQGDHPSEAALGPIDITGTRRCLYFGPYIQLPQGAWTCSVLLGCAKNLVGVGLTVEIFAGAALNGIDVEVGEPGLFEVEISFVNPNPDVQLEVRLRSMKPNFEGNILPGSVRLTPRRASRLQTG